MTKLDNSSYLPCCTRFLIKLFVTLVSMTFIWSFCFGIYFMVTFNYRKQCMVCEATEGEFAWFAPIVWYSDWALVTSTLTWFAWLWKWGIKKNADTIAKEHSSLFLVELSLPLSIFAMIGYTVYIGTSGWGADFVDSELCYTFSDSATPKEGMEEPSTSIKFYLAAHSITVISLHYLCPITNMVLYLKYCSKRSILSSKRCTWETPSWRPLKPIGVVVCLSVVVILAQEVGGAVIYCVDNIYTTALYAILTCTFCHALFFFRQPGDGADGIDTDDDEGSSKAEVDGDVEVAEGNTEHVPSIHSESSIQNEVSYY